MSRKVAIIGAGIAGLATGSYLQMNGFDVEIFEKHNLPGGLCTSWKRKGYTFDFCIHWLMGTGSSKDLFHLWNELRAFEGLEMVEWDEYLSLKLEDGRVFTVYTDPDRLREEMLRFGPEDRKIIISLTSAMKKLGRFDLPARAGSMGPLKTAGFAFRMVSILPVLQKWLGMTMDRFKTKLRSKGLKEIFECLYPGPFAAAMPVGAMLMMLSFMHCKSAGYPIGGSLPFAKNIEKRFLSLGGKIRYNASVDRIVVRDGKAAGIMTHGLEIPADIVISAADGYTTLYRMLEGKYIHPRQENAYRTFRRFPSLLYVSLGIAKDMRNQPVMLSFPPARPVITEDGALKLDRLSTRLFHFDPLSAPKGKTTCIVMIQTENDGFWTRLYESSREKYNEAKDDLARQVIDAVDAQFGDIKGKVEVVDVATPATVIRYTGNWHGSYEGFLPNPKSLMGQLPVQVPGLSGFYMVGQWVSPGGGLPPAGIEGRKLARLVCKHNGKKFSVKD
jgi:phytoene dehydrogenase-like protein